MHTIATFIIFLTACFITQAALADTLCVTARVVDRNDRPVPNIKIEFDIELSGVLTIRGHTSSGAWSVARYAATGADGDANVTVLHASTGATFRGTINADLRAPDAAGILTQAPGSVVQASWSAPDEPQPSLTMRVYEQPDLTLPGGYPVWLGAGGAHDRAVVLIEGFDSYNQIGASDILALTHLAGDQLRRDGIALVVVNFPNAHESPDALAPYVAEAVEEAAALTKREVVVAGLSMGGIVGRWALCTAENSGKPLPVNMFVMLDTPNRGANLNPALQAIVLKYGTAADKEAITCPAAQALLICRPADVKWRIFGIPFASRAMPVSVGTDTSAHNSFYAKLKALNDIGGYPKLCRLVAVSSGSRIGYNPERALFHLWLPFGLAWTLSESPDDAAPGSLLPKLYVDHYTEVRYEPIAGASLMSDPTFLPTTSALDALPGQMPPFDSWYARPDNAAQIAHDQVDPAEAAYVVRQIEGSSWRKI